MKIHLSTDGEKKFFIKKRQESSNFIEAAKTVSFFLGLTQKERKAVLKHVKRVKMRLRRYEDFCPLKKTD